MLEYPFVVVDRKKPQCHQIFDFVGQFTNLNTYEEVLRSKFYEKSKVWEMATVDYIDIEHKITSINSAIEERVIVGGQEFDMIDATNWLILSIQKKDCKLTKLSFGKLHALKAIN